MLTGYSKATVGYLAITIYFDNKEVAAKHNDILWVAAPSFVQGLEAIFRWRRADVTRIWIKWRVKLGDREAELRHAHEEKEVTVPGKLERCLVTAREEIVTTPKGP